jgi:hypothetical protein
MIRGGASNEPNQPKSSPTDEHARRIVRAIAKGRPPPFKTGWPGFGGDVAAKIDIEFAGDLQIIGSP